MASQPPVVQANRCLDVAAWTLLYYDYTLTLSMEYEQFWKQQKRLSLVAVLIVLNRYVSLLGEIPVIIFIFGNLDGEQCHWLDLYHQAFAAITQALVAALLMMRTVALYQRSKYILGLMGAFLILGCGTIILSITSYQSSVHFTGSLAKMLPGCVFPMTKEQTELSASPWCTMLLFDTAIFLLTLVRSIRVIRLLGGSGSMFQVMLRDGTIYFGALVVVNMANILTYLVIGPPESGMGVTITNTISSTLIARLMLNLRDPALNTVLLNTDMYQDEPTEDLGNMESVRFRSADVEDSNAAGISIS